MRGLMWISAIAALLSLTGCEKYALDRQLEQLCEKDSGVKIFETVTLPPDRFDDMGRVKPVLVPGARTFKFEELYGPDYRIETSTIVLKDGDPLAGQGRLVRYEHRLIRVSDKKTLGVSVDYGRLGGDLFVVGHFSSKGCSKPGSIESVFIRGE